MNITELTDKLSFIQGHHILDASFLNYNINMRLYPAMSRREQYNLYKLIKLIDKIDGDIIEIGVFDGGSAILIYEFMNKNKKLYLFDTFEGIVDVSYNDINYINSNIQNGQFQSLFEDVKNIFENNENVFITKGYFPECANFNAKQKFAFAHIDVDTYQSTLNSLNYLYPKITTNGIILSHDYNSLPTPGVKIAFDEFIKDKPEHIIELWDTQAMIIKI